MATLPPRINQAWIDDAERELPLQAPGERKERKIAEIEQAKRDRAFWDSVDEFMLANYSARVNLYPVKKIGADPSTVYYNKTTRETWAFAQAAEMATESIADPTQDCTFSYAIQIDARTGAELATTGGLTIACDPWSEELEARFPRAGRQVHRDSVLIVDRDSGDVWSVDRMEAKACQIQ